MALVKVTGEVTKPLAGLGYQISERITVQYGASAGQSFETKWAVWTKETLNIGDIIDVTGTVGLKQREYVDEHGLNKTTIDRSINDPKITVAKAAAPAPVVTESEPF